MSVLTPELIDRIAASNGASVSNAIETFDLRLRNEGFADGRLRCLVPDLAPAIGHAVTARIRCSAPPPVGHGYHDRTDWWNYIVSVPAPRIVVVEDVDERPGLGAFVGDVHATILQALGCVGIRDQRIGPRRRGVRRLGFQFFAGGVAVSHAFVHIVDFGEPVEVGGLAVATGDLLFGDAHGLQSVPPSIVEQIPGGRSRCRPRRNKSSRSVDRCAFRSTACARS